MPNMLSSWNKVIIIITVTLFHEKNKKSEYFVKKAWNLRQVSWKAYLMLKLLNQANI